MRKARPISVLYAIPSLTLVVQFLDKTNQLFVNRADFVTPEKPGTRCYNLIERVEPGVLSLPVAVCVDMEGRIYVRQNRERVSVFGF